MAAIQLNFTLRTSSNCKTVHLLGSWDGYQGQLPLSKDPKKSVAQVAKEAGTEVTGFARFKVGV